MSDNDKVKRVLICDSYGGFGLSRDAFLRLRELGCAEALAEPDWGEHYHDGSGPRQEIPMEMFGRDVPRDHPALLQVFDEMGEMAAGKFCHLALIEIPDDVFWHIEEYDGSEWIAEDHRTWYSSYE